MSLLLRLPRRTGPGCRAASLLVTLFIAVGCAALPAEPPAGTPAPTAPVSTAQGVLRPTPAETVTSAIPTAAPTPDPPALAAKATTNPAGTGGAHTSGAGVDPGAAQSVAPRFGPAWEDRTIFAAGLVSSEQMVLDELPGASEYRIDLRIDDSLTRATGEQLVRYTNRETRSLTEIYLRLFPNALGGMMRVSDVTVDGAGVTPEYQFDDTAVRVPLPRPLQVGQSTVVALKYEITAPTSLDKGYGLISYTNGILALDAPYAPIPVFNEQGWNVEAPPPNADTSFNDVSFYLVRITAPARLKLVVTGVEVARESQGDAAVVTYAQGPARDFFIAASPDYVVATAQVGETRVNSYALPGEEQAAQVMLKAATAGIEIYGKRFGAYPYTEFDVAATPMLALGIEYPGTVGVSERVYQPDYRPGSGSSAVIQESTLAHELAHQWFYNLVGNDQVDEPWLDEALAQYGTSLYFKDRYGEAAAEGWRATWGSRWDRTDRAEKPVGLPAAAYTEREYSAIVYGRGPLFLTALAERMGQDKFDQFLKDYAARFRWGIATATDFKAMAGQACGCELGDLYKAWLEP